MAESAGAPAWMITFADLMALLLTMFVLLLTFSEMDVVRYKQLVGSVRDAFGSSREDRLMGMIEVDGQIMRKTAAKVDAAKAPDPVTIELPGPDDGDYKVQAMAEYRDPAEDLAAAITAAIAEEIAGSGLDVDREGNEVIIRFPSQIAFASGSADLTPEFIATLDKLLPVLKEKADGQIVVSGHTDDVPVGGGRFSSNWNLSAERATAVVHHFLSAEKIPADRLTIQGFGESRPLVPNDSPENRAKNRRVEVSVVVQRPETAVMDED